MAQLIYAISALGIVVVVAVSMQRSNSAGEQSVYRNEVLTQLVTVGRDIVDDISRQDLPFDEKVDPNRIPQPAAYPYVHRAEDLTPSSEFGGCTDFSLCLDVDDFDGIDPPIRGERNGLQYSATIQVYYVSEDEPGDSLAYNTFAKEIVVTVESPVQFDGKPISAQYSRVITYPRITNYSY